MAEDPIAALAEEKRLWPGWSTIESEPAVFNELLKNIGVKDTQVEEVYSLDEESLNTIKPVHGLIFLFRWKSEVDVDELEFACPEGVWFANQVTDNLCASLAMLNIVMNCPDIDIGENLSSFKEYSKDLSPPLRGLALANFEYLRQCHNAFARKSEMTDADMNLIDALKKKKAAGGEEEDDEAFHFIAYIPISDSLWELDGLKRQPVKLGSCTNDSWLSLATPKIQERILRYEQDEIRFTLLAIVKKPLTIHRAKLSQNIKHLGLIDKQLATLDHKLEPPASDAVAIESDPNVDAEMAASVISSISGETDITKLLEMREKLAQEQGAITFKIRDEEEKLEGYTTYATRRQHDYSPFIRKMIGFLADKQLVQEHLQ
ncbi:ubiquitin carboxyl-terminal hydrolase [Peziza echinospora]|nr:ubiquitin carboxyl-terminal hydrolase [Peziza echinospora]